MATRDDLYQALRNADAAGDTEGAAKLAKYIATMPDERQATAAPVVAQASPGINDRGGLLQNMAGAVLSGAGQIGATILTPYDTMVGNTKSFGNPERRQAINDALKTVGVNTDSTSFKATKLGTEIAGTAGLGGILANGARALGASAPVVEAISSGGFSGGGNALTRAIGGAVSGGATAGLINPKDAPTGAVIGGAFPGVVKVAGMAGNALADAARDGSRRLMQSAIKPTIAQLRTGDADTAVQALLDYGISPTKDGVEKLRGLIGDLNDQVSTAIGSSNATVSKNKILQALDDVRTKFGNQVSPTGDLNAIENVANDFAAHPSLPTDAIPVQTAQQMKQGTYSVLAKKYGQLGSAETEAQKGLARGLKEEIATAVPGVQGLNAEESRLLTTLSVAERRSLMEMNKNPVGLTALAHNPLAAAGFMADRSAAFKALAARMINSATPASGVVSQKLLNAASNPLLRATGVVATEASP
jgi:hypothetical protein